MSQEIIYTSAPGGLKIGSKGFCTVASTRHMAKPLAERLEALSGYRHLHPPGDPRNPVTFAHAVLTIAGKRFHILSRVADAGYDYSQRTNKLAHHVAFAETELTTSGPAWALAQSSFMETQWTGEPRYFETGRPLPRGAETPAVCQAWLAATGDAGWAGVLAETVLRGDPEVYLIVPETANSLQLYLEAEALLPEAMRWQVTFTTNYTKLPPNVECRWRAVLDGTDEAIQIRRLRHVPVLDLSRPMGASPDSAASQAARQSTVIVPGRSARTPGIPDGGLDLTALSASDSAAQADRSAPPPRDGELSLAPAPPPRRSAEHVGDTVRLRQRRRRWLAGVWLTFFLLISMTVAMVAVYRLGKNAASQSLASGARSIDDEPAPLESPTQASSESKATGKSQEEDSGNSSANQGSDSPVVPPQAPTPSQGNDVAKSNPSVKPPTTVNDDATKPKDATAPLADAPTDNGGQAKPNKTPPAIKNSVKIVPPPSPASADTLPKTILGNTNGCHLASLEVIHPQFTATREDSTDEWIISTTDAEVTHVARVFIREGRLILETQPTGARYFPQLRVGALKTVWDTGDKAVTLLREEAAKSFKFRFTGSEMASSTKSIALAKCGYSNADVRLAQVTIEPGSTTVFAAGVMLCEEIDKTIECSKDAELSALSLRVTCEAIKDDPRQFRLKTQLFRGDAPLAEQAVINAHRIRNEIQEVEQQVRQILRMSENSGLSGGNFKSDLEAAQGRLDSLKTEYKPLVALVRLKEDLRKRPLEVSVELCFFFDETKIPLTKAETESGTD